MMVMISFTIPKHVDEYYKGKAAARWATKSLLLREVVLGDYDKQPDKDAFKPKQKRAAVTV